jgi:putative membrane protein
MSKRVMVIATMLIVGLFASLGLAQETTQDSSMKKDSSKKDSMKQDSMKANGSAVSNDDKKFIMEAAHGGMMEVELGKLAVDKASSPDVKQFAQRLIDDHSKANDELMQLASQKGIAISPADHHAMMNRTDQSAASGTDSTTGSASSSGSTTSMGSASSTTGKSGGADKDHQAMMKAQATKDKLSKYSGADFDREYMSMMVKDHTKDVKEFENASNKAKDPDVKAWASKTLPTLREHLQMARDINSKLSPNSSK